MGAFLSRLKGKLFGTRELRVLMLGLDNAGKTSMLASFLRSSHFVQAQTPSQRQNDPDGWV